jgi:hypothetical protein
MAPLLATVSAVLGLGGLLWEKLNHPAVMGTTGAMSAAVWWLDYALRNRVAKKEAARREKFERTPPILDFVDAKLQEQKLIVAIRSTNLVPFSCRWVCVTTANAIVGGIPIGDDVDVFPEPLFEKTFVFSYDLELAKIVDNYLELRFRYYSVHSAKFGNPKELGLRTLVLAWQTSDRSLTRIEPRPTLPLDAASSTA